MEHIQINKELQMLGLKNKLIITLRFYLLNIHKTSFSFFYRILELLKQKYSTFDDFNFIEQGIRCNITNCVNIHTSISNISGYIYNCTNEKLLKDLLNSIDTGINHNLDYNHEILQTLNENNTILLEQNNSLQRIEENTNTL
jgi:hypothetical protein